MRKKPFTLLSAFLFSAIIMLSSIMQAQSKKELGQSLAATTAAKDSIQKLYHSLSAKYDSVSRVCLGYDIMYKTIKQKVVHHDYKPADIGDIIDTLHMNRDWAFKKNNARIAVLRDSVKRLNHRSDSLRTELGHLSFVVNKYIGQGTIPFDRKDLSGTWELNTRWYKITEDSIQSGISAMAVSPDSNAVTKLIFLDAETVRVIYSKGDSLKCFYQVNSFAKDKPWTMDLTRGSKVNIRLNANPFEGELYVSYRKDKGYFYGFMRKK